MALIRYINLLVFCTLGFHACVVPDENPMGDYEEGVFIVNEGIYGQTSGSITFYNRDNNFSEPKIFRKVNNRDLGDVVQSMYFHNGRAYIIVNNSNKIEVADATTFEEKAQITGLKLPRYFMPVSDSKAYVSEWGSDGLSGQLTVLDLNTNTITKTISVSVGPEQLYLKNGKLYITHIGGYSTNNLITIINTTTDQIEKTVQVQDRPGAIVEDMDGNLWVACAGNIVYTNYPAIDSANSTESTLIKISTNNYNIVFNKSFGKGNPIGNLIINTLGSELYYTKAGQVWKHDIGRGMENVLFHGNFYGLGYDSVTDYIYAATSSGIDAAYAKRYMKNGTLVDSFQLGVFANSFLFN